MSAVAHAALGKTVFQSREGQIGGQHDRPPLVATADDLEEQVGGVIVVGEIADLVDAEHVRARVVLKPPLERARRLLLRAGRAAGRRPS